MLQPKRTKFRKTQKGRNRGLAQVGNKVSFGEYALQATTRGFITARQIEAARRAITRHVEYWVAPIQPGRVIYEIQGVSEDVAREAFRRAAAKLSVKTTMVARSL